MTGSGPTPNVLFNAIFATLLWMIFFSAVAEAGQLQDADVAIERHDCRAALTLLQPLAESKEQGDFLAQGMLGQMYEHGWGINKDLAEAYFWYSLRTSQLSAVGTVGLRDLRDKDNAGQQLTPLQKASIDKRVEAWRPTPGKEAQAGHINQDSDYNLITCR